MEPTNIDRLGRENFPICVSSMLCYAMLLAVFFSGVLPTRAGRDTGAGTGARPKEAKHL